MDASLVVLLSLVVVAFAVALARDVHLPLRGLESTGRLLRDAKLYEIGAGTSEIRRMLIGRELFRETA